MGTAHITQLQKIRSLALALQAILLVPDEGARKEGGDVLCEELIADLDGVIYAEEQAGSDSQ